MDISFHWKADNLFHQINTWQSQDEQISLSLSAGGDNFHSQILKREESEKIECLRGFKEFLPWIFASGLTIFLVIKRLLEIKYGSESSISNVDLGLF